MRIASIIALVVVATLFAAWWGWLRAPAPTELCEHVVEVTVRDTGERQMQPETRAMLLSATRSQCEQLAYDKLKLRGRLKYARWAKCMLAAQDMAGLGRC